MSKNAKYTLELCKSEALMCSHRSEWEILFNGSYNAALRNKWIKECSLHMKRPQTHNKKWTLSKCKEEALKYKTRTEWQKQSGGSYQACVKNKWLEECSIHFIKIGIIRPKWNKENCIKDALTFSSKMEWMEKSVSSYSLAHKRGWISECTKHMIHGSNSSRWEKEVLLFINTIFPNAKKQIFSSESIYLPVKRMELDIFIPEINTGIECNGDYWHGKGFKRNWTTSADRYHKVKRLFFGQIGIMYIDIWENYWKTNKEEIKITLKKELSAIKEEQCRY